VFLGFLRFAVIVQLLQSSDWYSWNAYSRSNFFTSVRCYQTQIHYIEALEKIGAIPMSLPVLSEYSDDSVVQRQLDLVDAVVIQGGLDVTPSLYNEDQAPETGPCDLQTDEYLLKIIKYASERKMPILGICRGLQILNVAFGGTLYQDFTYRGVSDEDHQGDQFNTCNWKHTINVKDGSYMATLFPENSTLYVNSFHHQSIKDLADGFVVDAESDDGCIEAFHRDGTDQWIFGVQFHPEQHLRCNDDFLPIFNELLKKAQEFAESSASSSTKGSSTTGSSTTGSSTTSSSTTGSSTTGSSTTSTSITSASSTSTSEGTISKMPIWGVVVLVLMGILF